MLATETLNRSQKSFFKNRHPKGRAKGAQTGREETERGGGVMVRGEEGGGKREG